MAKPLRFVERGSFPRQSRIDELEAAIDRNRPAWDRKVETPGAFVTGRSGRSKTLDRRLDAENERMAAAFRRHQEMESELERLNAIKAGWERGEVHPSGQLVSRATPPRKPTGPQSPDHGSQIAKGIQSNSRHTLSDGAVVSTEGGWDEARKEVWGRAVITAPDGRRIEGPDVKTIQGGALVKAAQDLAKQWLSGKLEFAPDALDGAGSKAEESPGRYRLPSKHGQRVAAIVDLVRVDPDLSRLHRALIERPQEERAAVMDELRAFNERVGLPHADIVSVLATERKLARAIDRDDVGEFWEIIDAAPKDGYVESSTVDWGNRKARGQGRRRGGMIMGAMGDAPRGKKTYTNLLGKAKLDEGERVETSQMELPQQVLYAQALASSLSTDEAWIVAQTVPGQHSENWSRAEAFEQLRQLRVKRQQGSDMATIEEQRRATREKLERQAASMRPPEPPPELFSTEQAGFGLVQQRTKMQQPMRAFEGLGAEGEQRELVQRERPSISTPPPEEDPYERSVLSYGWNAWLDDPLRGAYVQGKSEVNAAQRLVDQKRMHWVGESRERVALARGEAAQWALDEQYADNLLRISWQLERGLSPQTRRGGDMRLRQHAGEWTLHIDNGSMQDIKRVAGWANSYGVTLAINPGPAWVWSGRDREGIQRSGEIDASKKGVPTEKAARHLLEEKRIKVESLTKRNTPPTEKLVEFGFERNKLDYLEIKEKFILPPVGKPLDPRAAVDVWARSVLKIDKPSPAPKGKPSFASAISSRKPAMGAMQPVGREQLRGTVETVERPRATARRDEDLRVDTGETVTERAAGKRETAAQRKAQQKLEREAAAAQRKAEKAEAAAERSREAAQRRAEKKAEREAAAAQRKAEKAAAPRARKLTEREHERVECQLRRQRERVEIERARANTAKVRLQAFDSLPDACASARARATAQQRREAAALALTKADQRQARALEQEQDLERKLYALKESLGMIAHPPRRSVPGRPTLVVIPSARGTPRKIPARFVLVEAEDVTPSHDPFTFHPRPDYPPATQERAYEREPAEQLKVQDIARNMVPELVQNTNPGAVDGTPITDQVGIAISGNGRSMGVQRHYRSATDEQPATLRPWLIENGGQFGFSSAQVRSFKGPLVVREITIDPAERARLVRDTNESLTQRLGAGEEAAAKAKQLPSDLLQVLRDADADKLEPAAFFGSSASAPLVGALERSGYINRSNRTRLLASGNVFAKEAAGDLVSTFSRMVVPGQLPDQLRKLVDRSALAWLVAAAAGSDWDFRRCMELALGEYLQLKREDACLAQWREQGSLDGRPTVDKPRAELMLEIITLTASKPLVFAKIARSVAQRSREGGVDLFGGGMSPIDALRDAASDNGIEVSSALDRKRCRKKASRKGKK